MDRGCWKAEAWWQCSGDACNACPIGIRRWTCLSRGRRSVVGIRWQNLWLVCFFLCCFFPPSLILPTLFLISKRVISNPRQKLLLDRQGLSQISSYIFHFLPCHAQCMYWQATWLLHLESTLWLSQNCDIHLDASLWRASHFSGGVSICRAE